MAIPAVMTTSVNAAATTMIMTGMVVALSLCGVLVGCVLLLMTVVVALGLWKVLVGCILLLTVRNTKHNMLHNKQLQCESTSIAMEGAWV